MATIAQRSFASGEISPALYARVDQARYSTGLRQCRNAVVLRTGGTSIRPGTQFIAEIRDSTYPSRLLPFISSASQAYVVELCNGYMRFYKNGVQLANLVSYTITNISQSSPAVVTVQAPFATLANNWNEAILSGIQGMTGLNGRNFKMKNANAQAGTFQLYYASGNPVDTTTLPAYTSGGTVSIVQEINVPYVYSDASTLQFVQSADVMTITSRDYSLGNLNRYTGDLFSYQTFTAPYGVSSNSTLPQTYVPGSVLTFAPTQPHVVNVQLTASTNTQTAAQIYQFAVTAVSFTNQESGASIWSVTSTQPTALYPITLEITPVQNAAFYNIYVALNGVYGFVGLVGAAVDSSNRSPFFYYGTTPVLTQGPPTISYPYDKYEAIGYFQQRLILGSGTINPAGTLTSRSGDLFNFSNSNQVEDSDSLNFTIVGRQVQEVRHYLDLGALIVLTDEGEFVVEGNQSGVLTPGSINVRQSSFVGSSTLTPIVIGNSAIFVQARGSAVFDLGYDFEVRGFNGNELSLFANHLVDNYQITAWAYQKRPHQIVWAVRNDGVLLSLTYVKGESIVAWARHDTLGFVEDVVCIPEGTSDAVYLIVRRQINGLTKRYLERMATNTDGDYINSIYMDAALSYNGTVSDGSIATLSGGVNWVYSELLTLTVTNYQTVPAFTASDVGQGVQLTGSDGSVIRFTITNFVSPRVVQGHANKTVPLSLQNVGTNIWAKALRYLSGLWHLEGQNVSVLGDGFVVSSPNNADVQTLTVSQGKLSLDKPYVNIHVGLPYLSDLETLDIDTTQGEPLVGKEMLISTVHVHAQNTRGFWAGDQPPTNDLINPLENLTEMKPRNQAVENMNQPASMKTTVLELNVQGTFTRGGRVFIRQVDPVPTSILAVEPAGFIQNGGR